MLWLFLWIAWLWLWIGVLADVLRSDDLGGWGKAGWVLFTLLVPYLGTLVYLIARGSSMHERAARRAMDAERMTRDYIRSVAAPSADELTRLADLRDRGVLTEDEFATQKAKVLGA
jgi:hypothetical protein